MLAFTALAGAVALAGGLVATSGGVFAQTGGTPTPASNVGGPAAVPSARFFGSVTSATGPVAPGATVAALVGGVTCGTGTVSSGQYTVDVQAISGCTTPGATVNFTVAGQPATQTGTLPPVQGTAVSLNLTVAVATPTPAPTTAPTPPPPPTVRPTPPPPPTVRPTTAPTVAPTAVVPSRPPQTGLGGTSQQKPVAPVAQKPGTVAPVVVLPNTGTGSSTTAASLVGLLAVAGALGLSASGLTLLARRRA